jgi:tripartite-type tricarboxylate transporter receptor subunit TctC
MQNNRLNKALVPAIIMSMFGSSMVSAQAFPTRPVRIITSAAGGGNDFISRIIAQGISGPLGQQVVVENYPSIIATENALRSKPDGYTTLVTSSNFWITPLIQKTPYEPLKDFTTITMIDKAPTILAVHPSLPAKSVKDLVAIARSRPGELNYSSGGVGVSAHLAAELFKSMTGTNIVGIRYNGGGPQINALLAGEVQMTFTTVTSSAAHLKSGRLRALAVSSAAPFVLLPDLPTVAATLPGFEILSVDGMLVPAGTPAAIINRLNQEVVRFLNQIDVKERFLKTGVEIVADTPEQFAAAIKADISLMSKVVKDANIRVD